ncbi:MAG: aminodeoxychorismate synthase component I [Phycisphaerae bacterium]
MNLASPPTADVVIEPIDLRIPIESAVVTFSRAPGPAILESSLQNASYGRFSIFACDPVEVFSIDHPASGCPFRAFADYVATRPAVAGLTTHLPFVGGWIGFISYEAGLTIEGISVTTNRDLSWPLLRFNLYDAAAIFDHAARQWYLTAVAWPTAMARRRPTVGERLATLRKRLESAAALDATDLPSMLATSPPVPNMSHDAYLAKVDRAKRYIEAGDIYEVNLTQRFTTRTDVSPLTLYRRLRRVNPSFYAALLLWGDAAILSSSPELFLELRDGHVVTRPIKGTRPRGVDPEADDAYRRELIASEKDRAELNMIIDLLRNDLGRVCSFGSVRVTNADEIEEHPTLFHRVATIEGDLQPPNTWVDLLRAAFPGGSITGAPKIRAMQIIDELEPTARDVYCGSIGTIGLDGSMSLNIAIRTMIQVADAVHLYAGGAIVADSRPEDEYDEILVKAAGMLRALGCDAPAGSPLPQEVAIL